MVAYGEFRAAFERDKTDDRMVFYGMRHVVENYLMNPWTEDHIQRAKAFYSQHGAGIAGSTNVAMWLADTSIDRSDVHVCVYVCVKALPTSHFQWS
jgi:hypothetical protein